MPIIGEINDKIILYQKYDTETDWERELPDKEWLFLCITEIEDSNVLNEIARKIIDRNVCWASCAGKYGEKLHDIIDENVWQRESDIENNYLPDHLIMTTWEEKLDEELWYSANYAFNESVDIKKIFCLDLSADNHKDELIDLIGKIKNGFLPGDE
ncbi:MAG: hypothetical protein PHN88_03575 [Ignavibacteria bacterium]|nr:hypothetical protein [Ignavibacteria bacterium]